MTLDTDRFVDRRRLKRRLTLWRVVAVVALVALVIAAFGRVDRFIGGDYIARLVIDGIILEDPRRDDALNRLTEDSAAKALIVRIDSPGGSVVGGETLFHGLRGVAKTIPVVAVMGGTATSAGYMTALGADHIVARHGSVTGSIGVILQTADVTGLLEMLGVKAESIKSRPLKAQPNPLEPMTPEAREAARGIVLDLYDMFVDMVADRRSMERGKVLELADGRVFTGRQAVKNGLVDVLGGTPEARRWLSETHGISLTLPVQDVEIEHPDKPWRDYVGSFIGKTLFSERLRLDGLFSLWQPDLR